MAAGREKPAATLKPSQKPKVKGQHGGPRRNSGRMSKAEQLGLVELIDRAWPQESREKCFRKLGQMFEEGNLEAGKLLLSYAVGKPKEVREHTGPEGGAIRVVVEYADRPIEGGD